MLTLHNKDFTTKYGTINTTIEAFVEEERNGLFELSFIMLNTDSLFNYVKEDNIVVANANDTLLNQKFRIYMTRKLMNNRVEVFARHISFDLMYDYIDSVKFENQSCEYALNMLFRNSNFSKHYKGYSDIINAQDYNMSMANILEAIGGKEGSIIDTFGTGAELLRDNENIHVLNKRGHDNSVSIEYKKNLTGFELEEDTTELITRILPYAKYNDEENGEVVIKANYVDSPLIANYSHPFIKAVDYSDKFDDENMPTIDKLKTLAELEYKNNKVDMPKQNFKIEFIPLSKCVGYEGLSDNISLCDTVTILDTRYNINTQAKVIKVTYNVLKNRYESMELGEPRTSLGDIIGNNNSTKGEKGDKGDKGEPGKDGNIGDFPNSLPSTPVVTAKVYGFANIEISWTFENQVYYQYEVYASKEVDFTPNTFNLIHQGQTSSYLYQAKPNETWYFKVCCVNSHGERTDFGSAYATTAKIDDLSNYVSEMAIDEALIGTLSLDRGWVGELKGNYIDAKQLSVTDGNGKRTLDIDSFGNVNLDVTNLSINSQNVKEDLNWLSRENSRIEQKANSIQSTVSTIQGDYVGQSQLTQTVNDFEYKFQQSCANLLYNSSGRSGAISPWAYFGYANSHGSSVYINNDVWLGYETGFTIHQPNAYSSTDLGIMQSVAVTPGRPHTLICYIAGHRCGMSVGVTNANNNDYISHSGHYGAINGGTNLSDWHKITLHFTPSETRVHVRLTMTNSSGGDAYIWAKRFMLVEGTVSNIEWSPNPSEVMNNITNISSEGIRVSHNDGSYSLMSGNGFEWYNGNTGNRYHNLMVMGEYECLSEETKRIYLPSEFRGKPFKVITSIKRVASHYDLYTHKAPLLSFYAQCSNYNHSEGWIDIYASVRGWNYNNNMGVDRGQIIGDETSDNTLLKPVVAYWVIV